MPIVLNRVCPIRIVTSCESGQSRGFNEERIKLVTGGDPVTARFLYQEFFTYTPRYKIWLAVNTLPEIKGTDDGIWRRIRVIPFNVSFKGREDKNLTEKLLKELPGIMNWAICGYNNWNSEGLKPPKSVDSATNTYRSESDIISGFLDECTYKVADISISSTELFQAYVEYCRNSNIPPGTKAIFGRRLTGLGFERFKTIGKIFYRGISLHEVDREDTNNPSMDECPF